MSRTIASDLNTELSHTTTTPIYLVHIGFSTDVYYSSGSDISWDGRTWSTADIQVGGTRWAPNGRQQSNLIIGNSNGAIGTLILADGVANRAIEVWKTYLDSTGNITTPEPIIKGVGDSANLGSMQCTINIVSYEISSMRSPRLTIGPENGFNHVPAPGTELHWGNQKIILEQP